VGQYIRRPRSLSLGSPLARLGTPLIPTTQVSRNSPVASLESTPDSRDLTRRPSVLVRRDADPGLRSLRHVRNRRIRPNATVSNRRARSSAATDRSSVISNGGTRSNATVSTGERWSATSNGGDRSSSTSNGGKRSSTTSDGGNRSNVTVSKGRIRLNIATVSNGQNKSVVRVR
jgi:hypothetical protein